MKKLLTAMVLTLSTAAFAQGNANQQNTQQNTQAQQEQQRNEASRVETGMDASEVAPAVKGAAQDVASAVGLETEKDGTFKTNKAFTVNGTLKGEAMDGITLARQGLPDADLDVRDQTKVMLDGKRVKVDAIPEGAQVRAKFQLEGEEPVAVEINAKSPKGGAKKGNK